jgi:rhodanese-related sulfurtransferase
MTPQRLGDGLVRVDATLGTVQPIELAPGVRTIGEVELIKHLERGQPAIDTRQPELHREATIPGARGVPHERILEAGLDPTIPTVLFCNGPQCKATPDAIAKLLDSGYPRESIIYYRGGIHDWMTLGFPVVPGEGSG